MAKSVYISFSEVNTLQKTIMAVVDQWVHVQKTPIPQTEIIKNLKETGHKSFTVVNALNSLLKKGYIRRAYMISNKTYYVQLRRI